MTQYLVFDNPVGAPGAFLQKQVIVNWSNVKYIEPVDTLSFKLQLNNGGSIRIGAAVAKSAEVIEKIRSLITSSARISSGKVLTVKPDFIGQWTIDAIIYSPPSSGGGSIGGGGTAARIPKFDPDGTTLADSLLEDDGVEISVDGEFNVNLDSTFQGQVILGNPSYALLESGGWEVGVEIDMKGNAIKDLADPTLAQDAATKNYVDTSGGGVAWATEYDLALGNLLQGSNPGTTQVGTTTYGIGAGGNLSTPSGGSPKDSGNTAFGFNALGSENSEGYNTAVGYEALGNQNVSTMFAVPGNTALGFEAGKECTTGLSNVFVGNEIQCVNTGQSIGNVVVGSRAMEQLGAGFANVAIGERAMQNVNSNTGNIAIGYTANNGNTTGNQNIVIGYNAQPSNLTVSNEITLGNSSTGVLRCQQTSITALSDQRDKTSIEDLPYGLDFINKLQPRKFVWDNRVELREEVNSDGTRSEVEFYSANKGKKDFGFIAQEVQMHDDDVLKLVYDENPDKLEMSYGKLVPILVKAIQELKAQLDNKQDK